MMEFKRVALYFMCATNIGWPIGRLIRFHIYGEPFNPYGVVACLTVGAFCAWLIWRKRWTKQ